MNPTTGDTITCDVCGFTEVFKVDVAHLPEGTLVTFPPGKNPQHTPVKAGSLFYPRGWAWRDGLYFCKEHHHE